MLRTFDMGKLGVYKGERLWFVVRCGLHYPCRSFEGARRLCIRMQETSSNQWF